MLFSWLDERSSSKRGFATVTKEDINRCCQKSTHINWAIITRGILVLVLIELDENEDAEMQRLKMSCEIHEFLKLSYYQWSGFVRSSIKRGEKNLYLSTKTIHLGLVYGSKYLNIYFCCHVCRSNRCWHGQIYYWASKTEPCVQGYSINLSGTLCSTFLWYERTWAQTKTAVGRYIELQDWIFELIIEMIIYNPKFNFLFHEI